MLQTVRRGIWTWLGKALLAGVIAFTALTLFCMFYNNTPVFVACEEGSTGSKYEPNMPYCRMIEGLSYGRTNNDGYINLRDYDEETPVDVLVMGASHMEAMQIPQRCCTASLLDAMLPEDIVYNIGMTGHYLPVCASNLASAVKKYAPGKYVIIETGNILFSRETLHETLDSSVPHEGPNTDPLYIFLRRNPFIHQVVNQMQVFLDVDTGGEDKPDPASPDTNDPALLSSLLAKMADTATSSGARLIIAYHPSTTLEQDGTITFSGTSAREDSFAALCKKNGILFLNMRERFQMEYDENHILPYGFANTSIGSGHLNRYGHQMMAEELYALMQEEGL